MLPRALLAWIGLLALAVANGAFREALLLPRIGETGAHAVSSVLLAIAILVLSYLTIPWMAPSSVGEAWTIGGLWLVLTLAFEFLAGHYLFGTAWDRLLADYNVLKGRLWVLVLAATLLAPLVTARARHLLR